MTKYLAALCIALGGASLTSGPCSAQVATVTGHGAIADTITRLFSDIAEATSALDLDRLLAYYEKSEGLTYVAQGRVTRSHDAFSALVHAQFDGLAGADLQWLDTYVDVLSSDVAVATATYELSATLPDGNSVQSAGTYMCIYVRRDAGWRIRYSAHSFPPQRAAGSAVEQGT
jgi:ketosteroid isomerase-like protein